VSGDGRRDAAWRYRHSLTDEDAARHPCYRALCQRLSASEVACDLLASVPLEHRNPMLVLAALHYAAIAGDARLAPLYAPLGAGGQDPAAFAGAVIAVLDADPAVVSNQLHRTTQTNEVGRSAILQPVLRRLCEFGLTDIDVVDVGASAGLNLYVDHYRVVGSPDGDEMALVSEAIGELPSGPLPRIAGRTGIDLNPLDLRRDDDARWLRACLWPEDPRRLRRLELIERASAGWEPLRMLRGGVLERLDEALEAATGERPSVLWHTWAAAYFPPEVQREFGSRMRELAEEGRVAWVAIEWPAMVPGLAMPEPREPPPRDGHCQIAVALPGAAPEHWGWSQHHGRWVSLSSPLGPKA
jgi:hypothetical protein